MIVIAPYLQAIFNELTGEFDAVASSPAVLAVASPPVKEPATKKPATPRPARRRRSTAKVAA
mgnify:FL=1